LLEKKIEEKRGKRRNKRGKIKRMNGRGKIAYDISAQIRK
jgi:hypothetical protein